MKFIGIHARKVDRCSAPAHPYADRGPDSRVGWDEIVDIMLAACRSKNGWKSIRERCAPLRPRRHAAPSMARERP